MNDTVLCLPAELVRVAAGRTVTFRAVSGDNVNVRLATASELIHIHEAACRADDLAPTLTWSMAESMTRPVNLVSTGPA